MTHMEIEISRITQRVCDGTGVSIEAIRGPKRKSVESFARFILAYRLREYGLTLTHIADIMGKNHATIRYGLSQYDALSETCQMFRDMVEGVQMVELQNTNIA